MPFGGIGAIDESHQGGIGPEMRDGAEDCEIDLFVFIDGADQGGTFKSGQRIHEGRPFSGFHILNIRAGEMEWIHRGVRFEPLQFEG